MLRKRIAGGWSEWALAPAAVSSIEALVWLAVVGIAAGAIFTPIRRDLTELFRQVQLYLLAGW